MTKITLEIADDKDLQLLLPLLQRLGITFTQVLTQELSAKEIEYHRHVIAQGGDASNFGDASSWQREQRKDRDLPFKSDTR
jgi:hypothetical protein